MSPNQQRTYHDVRSQASSKAHELDNMGNLIPSRQGTSQELVGGQGQGNSFSSMLLDKAKTIQKENKIMASKRKSGAKTTTARIASESLRLSQKG